MTKQDVITIDDPSSRPVYAGMQWASARDKKIIAKSTCTPSAYIVEPVGDGRWMARHGYRDAPGRPNIELGIFSDAQISMLACERHDFRYWRSSSDRAGVDCVFMGSADHVAAFVEALGEHERDDIMDMIAGDFILPDGRSFATAASYFDAAKTALKQERNGSYSLTVSMSPADAPLWLMQTPLGSKIVIGVADTGGDLDEEWQERGASAIRRTFALCQDNAFQAWMLGRYDRWGLIRSAMQQTSDQVEAAVSETLKRIIGCPSRRDLATNREAIMRVEKIDREFYNDLSRSHPDAA
jgi:hypothetical protein